MTKKQKAILIVGVAALLCVLLTALAVFVIAPAVLRSHYRLSYAELIQTYAAEFDLDPYLVAGVIYTESKFDPDAVSRTGARGLMQIMPDTGAEIAAKLGIEEFNADALFDPAVSVRFGCFYLQEQMQRFDKNVGVVLAAYNAGPNRAALWLSQYGMTDDGRIRYIEYEETKNYVNRVLQAQENYHDLYPHAFD